MDERTDHKPALTALRAAYQAHSVATEGDARKIVMAAMRNSGDLPFDGNEISELTANCHRRLLREGILKRSLYGMGYVLIEAKPLKFGT